MAFCRGGVMPSNGMTKVPVGKSSFLSLTFPLKWQFTLANQTTKGRLADSHFKTLATLFLLMTQSVMMATGKAWIHINTSFPSHHYFVVIVVCHPPKSATNVTVASGKCVPKPLPNLSLPVGGKMLCCIAFSARKFGILKIEFQSAKALRKD